MAGAAMAPICAVCNDSHNTHHIVLQLYFQDVLLDSQEVPSQTAHKFWEDGGGRFRLRGHLAVQCLCGQDCEIGP